MSQRTRLRHVLLASLCVIASLASVPSAIGGVPDALQRPAVQSKRASSSVLLGVTPVGKRLVAVGERGIVVLSDDQGQTWRQAAVPASATLTAVKFLDAKKGLAVGHSGIVLATEDAGESWAVRGDGKGFAARALEAAKAHGDAVAIAEAQRLVDDGPDKPWLDMTSMGQRVLLVGAYGLAFASDDAGRTWSPWMRRIDNPKGMHLNAVRSVDQTVLIAGEQGLVLVSRDGGEIFRRLPFPYQGSLFAAEIVGPSEYVVAGLRGNVWRTSDGGANWQQIQSSVTETITASAVQKDGTVLLGTQEGRVLALQGSSLRSIGRAMPLPVASILPLLSEHIITTGLYGVATLTRMTESK